MLRNRKKKKNLEKVVKKKKKKVTNGVEPSMQDVPLLLRAGPERLGYGPIGDKISLAQKYKFVAIIAK